MRRDNGQAGYTLIELLVGATLALVVIGGPLTFLVTSFSRSNESSSRAVAVRKGQVMLDRLVRDLREAVRQDSTGSYYTATVTSTAPQFTLRIPTPGSSVPQQVLWSCTLPGTCTRQVGAATAQAQTANIAALTLSPSDSAGAAMTLPAVNPAYVGITLQVQPTSQLDRTNSKAAANITNPIYLRGGTDLRGFA